MKFYKKIFLISFITSIIIITGCNSTSPQNTTKTKSTKLNIVTTIAPLYSFTANIVGDTANIFNLIPPGRNVHTWKPSPSDIQHIAQADFLIINGLDLEMFIEDIITATDNHQLIIIDTSKGIKHFIENKYQHDEHHQTHHNPHIWLSLNNAHDQVSEITKQLSFNNPDLAEFYQKQAQQYHHKLNQLQQNISKKLNTIPNPPNFITFHGEYDYFLQEFNLLNHQKGILESSPGKEISPKTLETIINNINEKNVSIIFSGKKFTPSLVEILKQDYGLKVFEIDTIGDTITPNSYEDNIKTLFNTFYQALSE